MKKRALILVLLLLFALPLIACEKKKTMHAVQFLDDTTILKEVKVEDGKKVERYEPTKEGYEFIDWFSTPSKNHTFNFDQEIKEKTSIYAGFAKKQADVRSFYIVGSGTSNALATNNWGNGITEQHKMTKTENKNEYVITCDLLKGDEFQFAINGSWHHKRGYGYMKEDQLSDGTVVFSSAGGGLGESTAKGKNIKVDLSGNYTLTLKTYPAEDYYNTSDATYTEATKEVYNVGTYDKIEWVRNGDPKETSNVKVNYYIKGAGITEWNNMFNSATGFTKGEDNLFRLSVYLKQDEEFLFISGNSVSGTITAGSKFVKHSNLDESSKALFTANNGNLIAVEAGTYTFTYNEQTDKLSAVLDKEIVPAARDYYIDGTFAGAWGDTLYGAAEERKQGPLGSNFFINDYKLIETVAGSGIYQILGVNLPADSQIIIQSYKKDAAEPGIWDQEGYNYLGTFNHTYLLDNVNFEPVSATNLNIKVKTAGIYNIIFNSYSKTINITSGFDIYIKGEMNGWEHLFKNDWKMTKSEQDDNVYEFTFEFEAGKSFGFAKYNVGENDGLGSYMGKIFIGTSTEANNNFTGGAGSNFSCTNGGTYKVCYNMLSDEINFYNTAP